MHNYRWTIKPNFSMSHHPLGPSHSACYGNTSTVKTVEHKIWIITSHRCRKMVLSYPTLLTSPCICLCICDALNYCTPYHGMHHAL